MSTSLFGTFLAGVLTFLSPCVLPLAPILVANLISIKNPTRLDRLRATLWFTLGFSSVFVLLGLGLSALSSVLGGAKPFLVAAGGLLLAFFGLRMMGALGEGRLASLLTRSFHFPEFSSRLPKGLQGLGFGALFGLSWTPCVGPVLGGVLTYVATQEATPAQGALLLSAFALGISIPLLLIAAASDYVTPLLGKLKRHLPRIEYAAGVGLLIFGVYVIMQSRLQDFSFRGAPDRQITAVDSQKNNIQLAQGRPGSTRMIFFYSENCPICHAMEAYLPEFEKACSSSRFELVRLDVNRPENAEAATHFGVRAVPTIAVINDSGAELVHLVGYQTESRLRDAARTVTKLACTRSPSVTPTNEAAESLEKHLQPPSDSSCSVGAAC